MRHPNPNMLLRIAQGDAYAMALEYVKRHRLPHLFTQAWMFERYLSHPTHNLNPGCYTDDTQMSQAVAEALIYDVEGPDAGHYLSEAQFAEHFFHAFKRDPRDGYSRAFQAILEKAESSAHMVSMIVPNSNKNGAAMRSVPIGVLRSVHEVKRIADMQARVTHNTPGGINSAISVALMSHFALHEAQDFSGMFDWCCQHHEAHELFRGPWDRPVQGNSSDPSDLGVGMNTAWAVQDLLRTETSLMGIMGRVIGLGGDTDSTAAIAWGIASARYQDEQLPEFFERDLEAQGNLKYGPAYLKDLGRQLMATYDG